MIDSCGLLASKLTAGVNRETEVEWDPALRSHFEECQTCREQWSAHQALVGLLGGVEPPAPRGSLDLVVRARSTAASPRGGLPHALLVGYWLIAAAATVLILTLIPWARVDLLGLFSGAIAPLALLLFSPFWFTGQRLVDLFDRLGSRLVQEPPLHRR